MDSFSYLSVILSIVLGLAITQVLLGFRGLILTRAKAKLYPPKKLVVESIDLQRVRPPTWSELVGSHLRGDRLYGEVVSSRRPTLAVRSEIRPYRRPSQRCLALPKMIRDATPMKSSFPSTDGASQVRRSEGAGDDNS